MLIHIEVQSDRISIKGLDLFAERMFMYFCGLRLHYATAFQGYPVRIISVGILTSSRSQRKRTVLGPTLSYSEGTPDTHHVQFTFPVIHLEDWLSRWDELEARAATNPFAVIVMAQLRAQQTHKNDPQRLASKTHIMRLLYAYKYSQTDVQQIFRLADWMMGLSDELYPAFEQAMTNLEQEHNVSYVTSIERMSEKRGRKEGREEGLHEGEAGLLQRLLTRKFGKLTTETQQRIQTATLAQLETWSLNLLDATDLDDVFTD